MENNRNISEQKCDRCDYPRPARTKHIHFIKGTMITEDNRKHNRSNYPPIKSVFSKIDNMEEDNKRVDKIYENNRTVIACPTVSLTT